MYSGEIEGTGPRYCPSIEDKYVRFKDKNRHMLFLEPEGRNTNEWYINGLSTSLPFDVQLAMLQSVDGLEQVHMLRPAYAVEYDFAPPTQLQPSLESKKVENLFLPDKSMELRVTRKRRARVWLLESMRCKSYGAGSPLVFERHESYIGVLIDDLVTKGTEEPYRMFSSRAEHRLLFNHASAELRIYDKIKDLGLLPEARALRIERKIREVHGWVEKLENTRTGGRLLADILRHTRSQADFPEALQALPSQVQGGLLPRGLSRLSGA